MTELYFTVNISAQSFVITSVTADNLGGAGGVLIVCLGGKQER